MRKLLVLSLVLVPSLAFGQSSIQQNGAITQFHMPRWSADRVLEDAGGLTGKGGRGVDPFSVYDKDSLGLCSNDGLTTGAYRRLCLGHDTDGSALLMIDSQNGAAATGLKVRINGVDSAFNQVNGLPSAASNTALSTLASTYASTVLRVGFAAVGDSPAVYYRPSSVACTLNSGAGDGGSQIPTSDGKCWLANFTGMKPTPKIWGCAGNGTTDDSACFQAAVTAMGSSPLYSGPYIYKLNTGITASISGFEFRCDSRRTPGVDSMTIGLRAGTQNMNLITLAGQNQSIRNCFIDMSNNGSMTNASGTAITINAVTNSVVEENNIYGACMGIDVNGNIVHVARNRIQAAPSATNPNCYGIRVGTLTIHSVTTDAHLEYNVVEGQVPVPYGAGLLILDAGGLTLGFNDALFADYGMIIRPGVNQEVDWLTVTGTYIGDTNISGGLLIDTGTATSIVKGATFNQGWTASATNGPGVTIKNTGSGTVDGLHFAQHRAYLNGTYGFDIQGGFNITIDDSSICGNGTLAASTYDGIRIASGVTDVQVRNTRSSSSCDGLIGSQRYGVNLVGSNDHIVLASNNFIGNAVAPVSGTPVSTSIVVNNLGVDAAVYPTVASASVIALNAVYPSWFLTGTSGVSTINNPWFGRTVQLITTTGAVVFSTGGNICNAFTTTGAGASVFATYDASNSCWRMH